jgi:hypothetical protein
MRFDFEVCFLRFLGFCDVMMKTLAIIIEEEEENHHKLSFSLSNWTSEEEEEENHHKLSFSLSNWTSCLTKQ